MRDDRRERGESHFTKELTDLLLDVNAAPPPRDFGFVSDLKEPIGVIGVAAPQQHAPSSQNDHMTIYRSNTPFVTPYVLVDVRG